MSNPKRLCGHTKIADCPVCADTLYLAMIWAVENPVPTGGLASTRNIMQAAVDRYEAAQ